MVVSNPSLTWERLHDVFYRLRTCYTLSWPEEINLAEYEVALAPFSTAIAIYPKDHGASESAFYNAILFSQSHIKDLQVFSGAGDKLYDISWDESKNGKIVKHGWSIKEHLIVVSDNGTFRKYYDFENNFNEYNLGFDSESIGIADVEFYNTGFVVRLLNNSFICVDDYENPYPRLMALNKPSEQKSSSNDGSSLHCWRILPPAYSLSKNIEVVIAREQTIISLDEYSVNESQLKDGPFNHLSISPNGQLLTLYSASTHKVYIMTSNFQNTLSEFQIDEGDVPTDLKWCGNDVVVSVINNDELKVIGPGDDYLSFYYDSKAHIFTEVDGIRILSNEKLDFFSRVPNKTVDIFKIGSTTPSSILLDSIDLKNSSDPTDNITALENISIIQSSLEDAIDNCIEVSTEEFDNYWQKKLLKAAVFAKTHVDNHNPEYFIEVTKNLKILSQIRSYKVGMFLTYKQFQMVDFNNLINSLLLKRKEYLLAIKISEYLNLPLDSIYIDWCCSKIKYSNELNDDLLFRELQNKLQKIRNISYEKVSRAAYQEGRSVLSIMLINNEPISSKKIPLLIEIEEDELALVKAEETINFKLIEYVIFFLQNKLSLSEFLRVLNNKRLSLNYWESLMKALNNWYFLKNYYVSFDKKLNLANLNLLLSLIGKTEQDLIENPKLSTIKLKAITPPISIKQIENPSSYKLADIMIKFANKRRLLTNSIRTYDELKTNNKEIQDDLRYLKQELKLIETQESLQKTYLNLNFFGRSIIETLSLLIIIDNYDSSSSDTSAINKRINKILKEFKINEKRYYFLVIEKLSEYRKWSELYSFANHKKSPVGYEPFYKICVKNNAIRQAGLYIDLIGSNANYSKKIRMYLRVGNFKGASEEAFKNKDLAKLRDIHKLYKRTSHPNSVITQLIEGYIRKLS